MKLGVLIPKTPAALRDREIDQLTADSKRAGPGSVFFAIAGSTRDGHDFIEALLKKPDGPSAIVATKATVKDSRIILVENTRKALAVAAAALNFNPSRTLKVCGVTGTNGKTTTTYLLEAVLNESGEKTAVIGTVENRLGNYKIAATHTTPDAIELQRFLREFKDRGATAAAIEVTSHALDQYRTHGIEFRVALFTNLTQDHLDYHSSLGAYFEAKTKLFLDYSVRTRIVHTDDPYGRKLAKLCQMHGLEIVTFGKRGCDINYGNLCYTASSIEGELDVRGKSIQIRSPLLGEFNGQNIAGVVAAADAVGVPHGAIASAIARVRVPGRMETVPNTRGFSIVVDYSHTPDALEKALSTLKPLSRGRLICVFGCGGDRDATKRPLMGAIAERLADEIIITSDNPRTEDPGKIIDGIFGGLKNPKNAHRVLNRREAIAQAVARLVPGDILLIAGKGHEDYQIIGTQKVPFDDRVVAAENLR